MRSYGLVDTALCMKTTVDIVDSLLAEAELLAAEQGTTVRALIEEGLRQVVSHRKQRHGFTLRPATPEGKGIRPEVQLAPPGSTQ